MGKEGGIWPEEKHISAERGGKNLRSGQTGMSSARISNLSRGEKEKQLDPALERSPVQASQ